MGIFTAALGCYLSYFAALTLFHKTGKSPINDTLTGRLGQVIVDGEQGQLQPAGNPNFIENIGQMMLYRVLTERKFPGNFLIAQTGDDGS
jgi:hypothetical protein